MPNRHLRTVKIANYWGFERLDVQLGRINLVTGRNNTGKSSLLEALFMLSSFGNPEVATSATVTRHQGDIPGSKQAIQSVLWAPLFNRLDTSKAVSITATDDQQEQLRLAVTVERRGVSSGVKGAPSRYARNLSDDARLVVAFTYPDGKQSVVVKGWVEIDSDARGITYRAESVPALFKATIFARNATNPEDDASRLAELRQRKSSQPIIEALQKIEPALLGLEDKAIGNTPSIWADVDGMDELIPLAAMGEGLVWFTRILIGIADTPGGVVLIDEVGSGIHHTLLQDMWTVLDAAAKAADVQIVATTHSQECVCAAAATLDLNEGVFLHRMEIGRDGNRRCVSFDPDAFARRTNTTWRRVDAESSIPHADRTHNDYEACPSVGRRQ